MSEHVELTEQIIGAAIEVHRELGPGLLESAYQGAMERELELQGLSFVKQLEFPVIYKGSEIDCGYKIDLIVEDRVIVELKATREHHPIFDAQLLTYMKLKNKSVGLLINFHVPVLKDGIRRKAL